MPLTLSDKECIVDMTRLSSASILARFRPPPCRAAFLEPPAADADEEAPPPTILSGDLLPSLPVSSTDICAQVRVSYFNALIIQRQ